MKQIAFVLGIGLLLVPSALGQGNSKKPKKLDEFVGVYLTQAIVDQVVSPAGTFDCEWLVSIGVTDRCDGFYTTMLNGDGTIKIFGGRSVPDVLATPGLGTWERVSKDEIKARVIGSGFDTSGNYTGHEVTEIEFVFSDDRSSFSTDYTGLVLGPDVDPLDPEAVPNVTRYGQSTGRRF